MFILIAWRETNKIGQHAEPEVIGVYASREEATAAKEQYQDCDDFTIKEIIVSQF